MVKIGTAVTPETEANIFGKKDTFRIKFHKIERTSFYWNMKKTLLLIQQLHVQGKSGIGFNCSHSKMQRVIQLKQTNRMQLSANNVKLCGNNNYDIEIK